jgi:hypothetical protein
MPFFLYIEQRMTTYKLLNYLIAAVWLVNGLFCKVLGLVPRHQEIVATILVFLKLLWPFGSQAAIGQD